MVLLDLKTNPIAIKVFEAEIWTIDGSKKRIKSKYQPILYIRNIMQSVKIIKFIKCIKDEKSKGNFKESDDSVIIFFNKRTKIIFEFLYYPEYLTEGTNIIINDNLLKAYGVITKLYK